MKNEGELLREIRKRKKITQKEMADGLMSRQSYWKIENDSVIPDLKTLTILLEKLDYSLVDYAQELDPDDPIAKHFGLFTKYRIEGSTEAEIRELLSFAEARKEDTIRVLNLFGLIKTMLYEQHPEIIGELSKEDRLLFRKFYLRINNNHTLYELKLVADFAFIGQSYEEMKELFRRMEPFDPNKSAEIQTFYTTQIHKIYNNFTSTALRHQDIPFAEELIEKHSNFMKINQNTRVALGLKINQAVLQYLKTQDSHHLEELLQIADIFEYLYDPTTAKIVRDQYQHMISSDLDKDKQFFATDF